ncbi:hypothetical protein CRM22_006818 [Opisthorchis felineus]|uniref:Peptidase S1 domain-containing protein n=1 Tax=Opisthorchis felineus TaxID=147828 RepID=A0A4S2LKZ3_OPIFE|nr:hypothetical protein CRM22_006818 [Opisthorchis felineus]
MRINPSLWSLIFWPQLISGLGFLEYRIQNGYVAEVGEFPSIVLLTGDTHRCTGTLVAPDKILTAGHCACGDPMTQAYANITDLDQRDSDTVQLRSIVDASYPESYTSACKKLSNGEDEDPIGLGGATDIAILCTDRPFHLKRGFIELSRLMLHPTEEERENLLHGQVTPNSLVLGFGRDPSTETTGLLRFGFVNITPCPRDIQINTTGALCANENSNSQTPEVGDSGGPVVDQSGHVIGVTSISGYGWVVFSSVMTNLDFIRNHLM